MKGTPNVGGFVVVAAILIVVALLFSGGYFQADPDAPAQDISAPRAPQPSS